MFIFTSKFYRVSLRAYHLRLNFQELYQQPPRELAEAYPEKVVFLGDPQSALTHGESRPDQQASLGRGAPVVQIPHHQWGS